MIAIGKIKIHALYSLGHTIRSSSFVFDKQFLFSGDTLFIDSIDRPELASLASDWIDDLSETFYKCYRELSMELMVFPVSFMTKKGVDEDGIVTAKLGSLFAKNHGLYI